MKFGRSVSSFGSLLLALLAQSSHGATEDCSGDTTLSGSYDNVCVLENEICTLSGATVADKVEVKDGATLVMNSSSAKKVDMEEGSRATIVDSSVLEDVDGDKIEYLEIRGSTIGRDVEVKELQTGMMGISEFSVTDASVVKGRVKVTDSTAGSIIITDSTIMDNIEIEDNAVASITVDRNSLLDDDSGDPTEIEIEGNTVTVDISIKYNTDVKEIEYKKNSIAGDSTVQGNQVSKKLVSYENSCTSCQFLNNCAGEKVQVKKTSGDSLRCVGNNIPSPSCDPEEVGVEVDDNVVDDYLNDVQCNPNLFPADCGMDCLDASNLCPDCDDPIFRTVPPGAPFFPPFCACKDFCVGVCEPDQFCFCPFDATCECRDKVCPREGERGGCSVEVCECTQQTEDGSPYDQEPICVCPSS